MKLTKDHIGKKMRWNRWSSPGWFIPCEFRGDMVKGITQLPDGKLTEREDWWNGENWEYWSIPDREQLLIEEFGTSLKDPQLLLEFLDKRYERETA